LDRQDPSQVGTRAGAAEVDGREIGHRLRRARHGCRLRLADVARTAGCSEGFLSKVKNGRTTPSLQMLHRLGQALGISISELFQPNGEPDLVVSPFGSRPRVAAGGGIALEQIAPYGEGRRLEAHVHVLAAGAESGGLIQHDGEEVGYVAEGEVELTVADRHYRLSRGDSFFFKSELPHSYRNTDSEEARIVWVCTLFTF